MRALPKAVNEIRQGRFAYYTAPHANKQFRKQNVVLLLKRGVLQLSSKATSNFILTLAK